MVDLSGKNRIAQQFSGENSSFVTAENKKKASTAIGIPMVVRYFQIACTHTSACSMFVSVHRQKGSTYPKLSKECEIRNELNTQHLSKLSKSHWEHLVHIILY